MKKDHYKQLFIKNLEKAVEEAAARIQKPIPAEKNIELHGANRRGDLMSVDEAFDCIYISDDLFYPFIDIAVKEVRDDRSVIFVRISAYPPTEFSKTRNTPEGNGPFGIYVMKANSKV